MLTFDGDFVYYDNEVKKSRNYFGKLIFPLKAPHKDPLILKNYKQFVSFDENSISAIYTI